MFFDTATGGVVAFKSSASQWDMPSGTQSKDIHVPSLNLLEPRSRGSPDSPRGATPHNLSARPYEYAIREAVNLASCSGRVGCAIIIGEYVSTFTCSHSVVLHFVPTLPQRELLCHFDA